MQGSKISLANRAIGADRFLSAGLFLAIALLAAGLCLPIVETQRLIFFTNTFSIIDAIQSLYLNGEYAIAAIIISFSIIFPIAKIFVSFVLWSRNDYNEDHLLAGLKWLEVLSKWSFVDVMVVAVAIVVTKSTGLANATVLLGLYLYGASDVVSSFCVMRLRKSANEAIKKNC